MATYNAAVDNVYNYFLTTYAPKGSVSKYDTHKKSELRGVYNSMLQLNKDAPLYLFDKSAESRSYAVDLKENARSLRNTIASIGGLSESEMLNKKSAYSTDEGMVEASYIGEAENADSAASFSIEVTALASNQVNLGYALPSDEKVALTPGAYSFDISINDLNYEFQYNIRENDTNKDVQERLARLISKAGVGIEADVLENGKGASALRLTSEAEGLREGKDSIFSVSDDQTSKASGSVEYFGIDYTSQKASNAEFLLNGEERSASSNHFTIEKMYEINLKDVHAYEGQAAEIGLKTDMESITENINKLVSGYNDFIKTANEYREKHPASSKLLGEMERMLSFHSAGLMNMGISVERNGELSVDDGRLRASVATDEDHSGLSVMKNFAEGLLRKANQISLNPMEYVDKTVVAYKNPGHNFSAPYASSNYSGMLFNNYC